MESINGCYLPPEMKRHIYDYILDNMSVFKYVIHELKYLHWYTCCRKKDFPKEYFKIESVLNKKKRMKYIKNHYIHSLHEQRGYKCSWTKDETCFAYPDPKNWAINRSNIVYHGKVFYNNLLHPKKHVTGQPIYMRMFLESVNIWSIFKNKLPFSNIPNIKTLNYILGGHDSLYLEDAGDKEEINESMVCDLLLTLVNKSIVTREIVFNGGKLLRNN